MAGELMKVRKDVLRTGLGLNFSEVPQPLDGGEVC